MQLTRDSDETVANLVLIRGQHGADGEDDFANGQCRRPAPVAPIVQDVQADVTITIYVWVDGRRL